MSPTQSSIHHQLPKKVPFAPFLSSTAGARKIKDLPTKGMQQARIGYPQCFSSNEQILHMYCQSLILKMINVCSTEKYTKRSSNTVLSLVYFSAEQTLQSTPGSKN